MADPLVSRQMPKEEIGAAAFLRQHPQCDGRGIVVAVFDTGVDPGADGLRVCTDGSPKMLDVIDCTGSGDVDTSHRAAATDGTLKGLSGRTLTLPPAWPAPTAAEKPYFLGVKRAFELYPRGLTGRVKAERRKRTIDGPQRDAVNACQAALLDKAAAASDNDDNAATEGKKWSEELKARAVLLEKLDKDYDDSGPLYDVLCYMDDSGVWRVCVDTSEGGDLASCTLLAPFRVEHQHGTLDDVSLLNYACDVFDEGRRVVLSVDSGSHGTHVAGIIGAHYPEKPELNGVAPGCKIVGVKIGDTRLDGMETGTALTRALAASMDRGVHLINLSFGEYGDVDNYGRFTELCRKAVERHGLLFVTSAGNNGPALTTGGAPGTSDCVIAVGAFASALMMQPQYSLRTNRLSDIQYTWSSRGPTCDGAEMVSVSAPGAAIAPVPNWTLDSRQLMNGTSMASPCACGGVALLLSACKARQEEAASADAQRPAKPSSRRVRMAIEATALATPNSTGDIDRWALGRGLLQVGAAWDWMCENEDEPLADVRFRVTATLHGAGTAYGERGRGIYLREPQHVCGKEVVACTAFIKPTLHEDAPHAHALGIDLHVHLAPSAPWVSCAPSLPLLHGGKGFELKLSVGQLPPGCHHAEILGTDDKATKLGPLFRVPITVVKPHANLLEPGSTPSFAYADFLPFTPGHLERRFVVPPLGATWATITLEAKGAPRSRELGGPVAYMVHAAQILPSTSMRHTESATRVSMSLPTDASAPPAQWVSSIAVSGGVTLEVTVAQWWMSLGDTEVQLHVEFYGLTPSSGVATTICTCPPLFLDGRTLFGELEVVSPFRRMPCQPSGTLSRIERAIRPHAARLVPPFSPLPGAPGLGDTWEAPDRRIVYDYVLAYKFTLKDACTVDVRFPSLNCQLYESPYDAQLWGLFDSHKRLLGWGDYYAGSHDYPVKLGTGGDFEVRLQVRHEKVTFLEKLRHMPMLLHLHLEKPVPLAFHWSRADALGMPPPDKLPARVLLEPNARAIVYVTTGAGALPDHAQPGDTLIGSYTLAKLAAEARGAAARPRGFPVSLVVPPAQVKDEQKDEEKKADDEPDPASAEALAEGARAHRIGQLGTLASALKKAREEEKKQDEAAAAAPPAAAPAADAPAAGAPPRRPPLTAADVGARYDALLQQLKAECEEAGALEQMLTLMDTNLTHTETLTDRKDAAALNMLLGAAVAVVQLIDAIQLAAAFGKAIDKDDVAAGRKRKKDEKKKKALVHALHVIALSAADRHALDANATPLADVDSAMRQLHEWAAPSEHTELTVRWHRAHGRHAIALGVLDESIAKEKGPPSKENLQRRAEILGDLGWKHWSDAAMARVHEAFPLALPPVFNHELVSA